MLSANVNIYFMSKILFKKSLMEKSCLFWLPICMKTESVSAQKMKFSIKDFFSKYDEIRKKLRIWSQFQKKSLMENFIFCAFFVWRVCLKCKYLKL